MRTANTMRRWPALLLADERRRCRAGLVLLVALGLGAFVLGRVLGG